MPTFIFTMESYFISPPEATDLKIDPTNLIESLQAQWSNADIQLVDNQASNHSLQWTLQMKEMELDCSLDKTEQVVNLYGDVRDCAKFALWFRSQVPNNYKLVFYDEGYYASVELEKETTEGQILEPFLLE